MKVIFAHGKESGPWGSKIQALATLATARGCAVDSIDYQGMDDPDARVRRLLDELRREPDPKQLVLVGSSMGGYVSLVASESIAVRGVFLLAPALYIAGFGQQHYHSMCRHIEIVHGWSDDVIPPENSIRYAREADCALHMISGDHALNGSLGVVAELFERFLRQVIAKTVAVSESAANSDI